MAPEYEWLKDIGTQGGLVVLLVMLMVGKLRHEREVTRIDEEIKAIKIELDKERTARKEERDAHDAQLELLSKAVGENAKSTSELTRVVERAVDRWVPPPDPKRRG